MTNLESHSFSCKAININTISSSSGVFIGKVQANYWNHHSKSNQGIGQLNNSHGERIFGIVQDNDEVDVSNRTHNVMVKPSNAEGKLRDLTQIDIRVNGVHVNTMQSVSSITFGENSQDLWNHHSKENLGTGRFAGINTARSIWSHVDDRDYLDSYNYEENKTLNVIKDEKGEPI